MYGEVELTADVSCRSSCAQDSKRASVYRKSAMVVESVVTCLVKTQQENTKKQNREYYPKEGKRSRECCPKAREITE